MATTTVSPKDKTRVKKDPIAPVVRITDAMKRATLGGKLSADELDKLAQLASALKTFVQA